MCAEIVKDVDLKVGDIIEINNGLSTGFVYNIHRDDNGISGYKLLRIEDYYIDTNTDDAANIDGSHIGEVSGRNFVIYYRPDHFNNTAQALQSPRGIRRVAQTAGSTFFEQTLRRANRRSLGQTCGDERTSGSMRSPFSRLDDYAVFGTREAPQPRDDARKRKPYEKRVVKADYFVKIPDITLDDAVKVGLISERALHLLTIKPAGEDQWPDIKMLSEAHALLFPKKDRITPDEAKAEGQRRQHVGAFLTAAFEANKTMQAPLIYANKKSLGHYFRKRLKEASTIFNHDMALNMSSDVEPHVRDSVTQKYQGVVTLYDRPTIARNSKLPALNRA